MAAWLGAAAVLAGCVDREPLRKSLGYSSVDEVRKLGNAMDEASLALEQYGTVSVSSPLLASANRPTEDQQFSFSLTDGPNEYYDHARKQVQARLARSDMTSEMTRTTLDAQVDVTGLLGNLQTLADYRSQRAAYEQRAAVSDAAMREAADVQYQSDMAAAAKLEGPERLAAEAAAKKKWAESQPGPTKMPEYPTFGAAGAAAKSPPASATSVAPTPKATAVASATPSAADPPAVTPPTTSPPSTTPPATSPPAAGGGSEAKGDTADKASSPSAADAFNDKTFTKFAGLLTKGDAAAGSDVALASRAAINIAAGDTASEAIFSLLMNPTDRANFKDKKLLFGVSMVSVAPGWRSKENYAADISLRVGFKYRPARREVLAALYERLTKLRADNSGESGAITNDQDLFEAVRKALNEMTLQRPASTTKGFTALQDADTAVATAEAAVTAATTQVESAKTADDAAEDAVTKAYETNTANQKSVDDTRRQIAELQAKPPKKGASKKSAGTPADVSVTPPATPESPQASTPAAIQSQPDATATPAPAAASQQPAVAPAELTEQQRKARVTELQESLAKFQRAVEKSLAAIQTAKDNRAATLAALQAAQAELIRASAALTEARNKKRQTEADAETKAQQDMKHAVAGLDAIASLQATNGPLGASSDASVFAAEDQLWGSRMPDPALVSRLQLPRAVPTPLVAAVSPMTDSDVLDEAASSRRQQQHALAISLALAYAGQKGNASFFRDYAQRLEDDAATRGAANAVTAYSHSGGLFGFQVGPRVRADGLAPLQRRGDRPVARQSLDRQSFPVLVIVGMDRDDLGLRFGYENGVFTAYEPALTFDQSFRWLPLDAAAVHDRGQYIGWTGRPDVEELRVINADRLFTARRKLPPTPEQISAQLQTMFAVRAFAEQLASAEGVTLAAPPSGTDKSVWIQRWNQKMLLRLRSMRAMLARLEFDEDGFVTSPAPARQRLRRAAHALSPDWPTLRNGLTSAELEHQQSAITGAENDGPAVVVTDKNNPAPPVARLKIELDDSTKQRLFELIDAAIDAAYAANGASSSELPAFIRSRMDMLAYQAYGSSNEQAVPEDLLLPDAPPKEEPKPGPMLDAFAAPISGERGARNTFLLTGKSLAKKNQAGQLEPAVSAVTLRKPDGSPGPVGKVAIASEVAMLVTFDFTPGPATTPPTPLQPGANEEFDVVATLDKANVTVGHVIFDRPSAAAQAIAVSPGLTVTRDGSGRVTAVRAVNFPTNVDPAQLSQWLRAITAGDATKQVEIDVDVPGGAGVHAKAAEAKP